MPDPIRIRAQATGSKAVVRVLVTHAMHSGQGKDAAGAPIPAWYVQQLSVRHNGRPVMSAQWGPAVSKNPFLQFTLRGARAGDTVAITWVDNRGDTRTDETTVT